jgi:hypothetical protein
VAVKRAIPKVSPRAAHSKPPLRSQRPNSAPPLTRLPAARHRLGRRSRPGRLHFYRLLHELFLFLKDGPDHITRGVATRRHEAPGMSAGAEQTLAANASAPRAPDLVTGLLTDGSEHLNPMVTVLVHHGSWIAGEEPPLWPLDCRAAARTGGQGKGAGAPKAGGGTAGRRAVAARLAFALGQLRGAPAGLRAGEGREAALRPDACELHRHCLDLLPWCHLFSVTVTTVVAVVLVVWGGGGGCKSCVCVLAEKGMGAGPRRCVR